jgi:hypothetical protein
MNIKGILNFFEEHIEKIVLVLVSIFCVWLLLTWVVLSPNRIEYEGRKFMPADIDSYIYDNVAVPLNNKLSRLPEPAPLYEPEYDNYVAWVDSPISNINLNIYPPIPGNYKERIIEGREYDVPVIGEVTEAVAEHIRAVAYVPTEEITPVNSYDKARHEPNDIDLVTVEAKFDVAKLYENFYENFAGSDVQREWQDPCLAKPIFAAVDLQRKVFLSDGSWSDWKTVPRAKIDSNKELFKIIEDVTELPSGGIKVRLLQFGSSQMARSLLQPNSYSIASPKEEWFPPHLHEKYIKVRDDIEREDRRKAAEQAEKERSDKTRRNTTTPGGGTRGTGISTRGGGLGAGGLSGLFSSGSTASRGGGVTRGSNIRGSGRDVRGGRAQGTTRAGTDTTPATDTSKPKQTTVKDIEDEFNKLLITAYAKMYKLTEPLVFWALDDSAKPNQIYRYRVRLGVFNPMAGTKNFTEEYQSCQDKVILWSMFSNETESLEIPGRLYFFPLSVQQDTKSVDIQVSKYVLGYWHSNRFQSVKPGESIGKVAKVKPLTEEEKQKNIQIPKEINYDTNAILVDVVPVNEWVGTSNLNRQGYNDMLYSFDGKDILRMPIKSRYWANDILNKYNEINLDEKKLKEPLRGFGAKSSIRQRIIPREKRGPGQGSMLEQLIKEAFERGNQ